MNIIEVKNTYFLFVRIKLLVDKGIKIKYFTRTTNGNLYASRNNLDIARIYSCHDNLF